MSWKYGLEIELTEYRHPTKIEVLERFRHWRATSHHYGIICVELLTWYSYECEIGNIEEIPSWERIQMEVRFVFPIYRMWIPYDL